LCCKQPSRLPSRLQDFDPNSYEPVLDINTNDKADEQTNQLLHITDIWLTWILPYANQSKLLALRATCRGFESYILLFANRRHPQDDNLSFEPNPDGIEFAITHAVQDWAELGAFCASFPFMVSIAGPINVRNGMAEPVLQRETFQELLKNRRHLEAVQTQLCRLADGDWLPNFIPEEQLFHFINLRIFKLSNTIYTDNARSGLDVKHLPKILTTHKHIRKIDISFDEPSCFVEECPVCPHIEHAEIMICRDAYPNQAFIVRHIIRIFPNITHLNPPQNLSLNENEIKNETLTTIIFGLPRLRHLELWGNAIQYLSTLRDKQHKSVETITCIFLGLFLSEGPDFTNIKMPDSAEIALSLQHVFPNLREVSVRVSQPDGTVLGNTHIIGDAPQENEEQGEEEEECEGEDGDDDEDSEEEEIVE